MRCNTDVVVLTATEKSLSGDLLDISAQVIVLRVDMPYAFLVVLPARALRIRLAELLAVDEQDIMVRACLS